MNKKEIEGLIHNYHSMAKEVQRLQRVFMVLTFLCEVGVCRNTASRQPYQKGAKEKAKLNYVTWI
ncbi:hypothetical protein KU48_04545 [Bacillus safensis]|nr:hypothetical protein KU48_04545 [Bacillus safensis]